MGTRERRTRERAEREQRILAVGRRLLLERSFAGLTMDRVAEKIEYSKGIVYKHFTSKEDLICGMTAEFLAEILGFFRRAAVFHGSTRERLTAIVVAAQLHFKLAPDQFEVQQISTMDATTARASAPRKAEVERLTAQLLEFFRALADEAVRDGDLTLSSATARDTLVHGAWCMLAGAETLGRHERLRRIFKHTDLDAALRRNLQAFLDGHGWKPLSRRHDYEDTAQRVLREVFPQESLRAAETDPDARQARHAP